MKILTKKKTYFNLNIEVPYNLIFTLFGLFSSQEQWFNAFIVDIIIHSSLCHESED